MFCCCGSCRSRQTLGAWCDIEANGAVRARITSGRATGVLETGTDLFEEHYELRFVYRARCCGSMCVAVTLVPAVWTVSTAQTLARNPLLTVMHFG